MKSSALRSTAALAALALHVASASGETSHRLRGSFESDVVDAGVSALSPASSSISRELQAADCVATSVYLGCFKDRKNARAMEFQVPGKDHSAATCEAECSTRGYMYFGREWKGQCFCDGGGGGGQSYDVYGPESNCDCCKDNVGANKMCVWTTMAEVAPKCDAGEHPSSPYLGCYKDKNLDRAMPYQVKGRNHSARDCQEECTKKGYAYFAREWRGQCFCGNAPSYSEHGPASDCDCCGSNVGANKMCVWDYDD